MDGGQVQARPSARTGENKAGFKEPWLFVVIYHKEPILDDSSLGSFQDRALLELSKPVQP